jgi:hypothetical protein
MFHVLHADGSILGIPEATHAIREDDGSLSVRDKEDNEIARFKPLSVTAYGQSALFAKAEANGQDATAAAAPPHIRPGIPNLSTHSTSAGRMKSGQRYARGVDDLVAK